MNGKWHRKVPVGAEIVGRRRPASETGFTLIELLVVISVIALLIAILVPTLQRVRRQAKSIVCQSKLRQWGQFYNMYMADNESQLDLPGYQAGKPGTNCHWLYQLRPYWRDCNDVLLCPATRVRPPVPGSSVFGLGRAWFVPKKKADSPLISRETGWDPPYVYGSYGLNGWLVSIGKTNKLPRYWRGRHVKLPANVPAFCDCLSDYYWAGAGFAASEGIGPPPEYEGDPEPPGVNTAMVCIDRHEGGINVVFLDGSVRKVGLKELWALKWHRKYNRSNQWTLAGGVQPEDWPEWMRKFKDY